MKNAGLICHTLDSYKIPGHRNFAGITNYYGYSFDPVEDFVYDVDQQIKNRKPEKRTHQNIHRSS